MYLFIFLRKQSKLGREVGGYISVENFGIDICARHGIMVLPFLLHALGFDSLARKFVIPPRAVSSAVQINGA